MTTTDNEAPLYYVWGADRIVYGPVELPTLVDWIHDQRVLAETWLCVEVASAWMRARDVAELKLFFRDRPKSPGGGGGTEGTAFRVNAERLRRIKLLGGLEPKALESLLRYMQPMEVGAFTVVVQPGEEADSMYFILEGELRAYVVLDGKETTLATMLPGESFGEVALIDQGPRSAFVATNVRSLLLRMPAPRFNELLREAPALAMPFALGLARLLAARLRLLNKKYEDSIRFSRAASV